MFLVAIPKSIKRLKISLQHLETGSLWDQLVSDLGPRHLQPSDSKIHRDVCGKVGDENVPTSHAGCSWPSIGIPGLRRLCKSSQGVLQGLRALQGLGSVV